MIYVLTHLEQHLILVWFLTLGVWGFFSTRALLAYQEKEQRKFEAFMKRMSEK